MRKRSGTARTGIWHTAVLLKLANGFMAALLLTMPAAAQSHYPRPDKGMEAPLSWLQQFDGAYTRSQDRPDGTVRPTANLINAMDGVIIPLLQPWAAARREATDFEIEEDGQVCRPTGLLLAHVNRAFYLVASPGRITFVGDRPNTTAIRRIYLDRGHLKNPPLNSWGDSIAYREGDTLVIDTIGFNDKSFLSLDATRHSTELHIVERWRLVAERKYLEKVWVVDDPRALKAPFIFTRYHPKMPAGFRHPEEPCASTPDVWRAWTELHNDAVTFDTEKRAKDAKALMHK
jgi:hypothetical protein